MSACSSCPNDKRIFMVAIFWDYGSCQLPPGASPFAAVNKIRKVAHTIGPINLFKAYYPWSERSSSNIPSNIRSDLQASGVSLIDCPSNGNKDVASQMILVDMLTYAMDNLKNAVLVLISGNPDFAYTLSTLRFRQYQVIAIVPSGARGDISSLASVALNWNCDIVGEATIPYPRRTPVFFPSSSGKAKGQCTDDIQAITNSLPTGQPRERSLSRNDVTEALKDNPGSRSNNNTYSQCIERNYSTSPSSGSKRIAAPAPQLPPQAAFCTESLTSGGSNDIIHCASVESAPAQIEDIQEAIRDVCRKSEEHSAMDPTKCTIAAPRNDSRNPVDLAYMANEKPCVPVSTKNPVAPSIQSGCSTFPVLPSTSSSSFASVSQEAAFDSTMHSVLSGGVKLGLASTGNSWFELLSPTQLTTAGTGALLPSNHNWKPSLTIEENVTRVIDFTALVEILRAEHANGSTNILRSKVGQIMTQQMRSENQQAGVASFREYVALAEARGVIQMGGVGGHAWISLHPKLRPEPRVNQPTESRPGVECTTGVASLPIRRPPPEFALLMELLKKEHLKGNTNVPRSAISIALLERDKSAFQRAGVHKFREYSALAVEAGVVQMGGWKADAWIALHPDWRDYAGE